MSYSIKKDGYLYTGTAGKGDFTEMEIFPELASMFDEATAQAIAQRTDGECFYNDTWDTVGRPSKPTYENMGKFHSLSGW
jgi:hypothetical protein